MTTRSPRAGEERGRSYTYVTREAFDAAERAGTFLECAEYVGHRYGTPRRPVEEALTQGRDVVMEIDVQGGQQVARAMPQSVRVFLVPPDAATLRARLEGRRTEDADELARRLAVAEAETAEARASGCYPYFVVNDVLEDAIAEVLAIVERAKVRS
jgi:guanylate kinase